MSHCYSSRPISPSYSSFSQVVRANFWEDFVSLMSAQDKATILTLELCDFDSIEDYKSRTRARAVPKQSRFALVDGLQERIDTFRSALPCGARGGSWLQLMTTCSGVILPFNLPALG